MIVQYLDMLRTRLEVSRRKSKGTNFKRIHYQNIDSDINMRLGRLRILEKSIIRGLKDLEDQR